MSHTAHGIVITGAGMMTLAGAFTVLAGFVGLVWKFFGKPVFTMMGRTNEFLDDWFGVPDRDGVPGRKGVMHRLSDVEIGKADREEISDLVRAITQKADKSEVQALRDALDEHIRQIDLST